MKWFGLSFLVVGLTMTVGCSKKKESKKASTKTATKASKAKGKAAVSRTTEVKSLKTHCPPRLSLYINLVNEYESAAKAKAKGDAKPLTAFGAKMQQLEKMTVGFQRSTLNTYCRTFFNPAVQRFTAATALVGQATAKPAPKPTPGKTAGAVATPGASTDVKADTKTMKAANKALQGAACAQACAKIDDKAKKATCLSACPK